MRELPRDSRFQPARDWPLLAALLALLMAAGIVWADGAYRHDGTVVYPALIFVNYTLRGTAPQVPWLVLAAAAFVALWIGRLRQHQSWLAGGLLIALIAGVGLIGARSPYLPLAAASAGGHIYRVSSIEPDSRSPELYLLFRCGKLGIVCQQVSAYAPFDLTTGRHVTGPVTVDATSQFVTLRIAGYAIGTFRPPVRYLYRARFCHRSKYSSATIVVGGSPRRRTSWRSPWSRFQPPGVLADRLASPCGTYERSASCPNRTSPTSPPRQP